MMGKQEQQPETAAKPQRFEDLVKSWGKLKAVYVADMRGMGGGDGRLAVGATVSWPEKDANDVVHGARIESMEICGSKLVVTAMADSSAKEIAGIQLRMLVDLANCICLFESAERSVERKAAPSPRTVLGQPLGDVLLRVEALRGAFTEAEIPVLKRMVLDPEFREIAPRIVEALRIDSVRKAGGVPSEPGARQVPPDARRPATVPAAGAEAEAVGDEEPLPAGRIETTDPRDRVAVMVKGK